MMFCQHCAVTPLKKIKTQKFCSLRNTCPSESKIPFLLKELVANFKCLIFHLRIFTDFTQPELKNTKRNHQGQKAPTVTVQGQRPTASSSSHQQVVVGCVQPGLEVQGQRPTASSSSHQQVMAGCVQPGLEVQGQSPTASSGATSRSWWVVSNHVLKSKASAPQQAVAATSRSWRVVSNHVLKSEASIPQQAAAATSR